MRSLYWRMAALLPYLLALPLAAAVPEKEQAWNAVESLHNKGYLLLLQEQNTAQDRSIQEARERTFAEAADKLEVYLDRYVTDVKSIEYLKLAYQAGIYQELAGRRRKAAAWYEECISHPLGARPEGTRISRLARSRLREVNSYNLLTEIESRGWTTDRDADAVKKTGEEWVAAFRAKDPDQLGNLLAEDVVLLLPGCEPLRGRDAVLARFRETCARFDAEPGLAFADIRILDDTAVAWGEGTLRLKPLQGGVPILQRGDDMTVLQRDGRRWKVVRGVSHLLRCPQSSQKGG